MLPEGHLSQRVLEVCAGLDYSGFDAAHRDDGQGGAPYDPAMMVALIIYCALKRRRSVRELAEACVDDLGARLIAGGLRPAASTFSRFGTRHKARMRPLLVQVLGACVAAGVPGDDLVAAIDGSPAAANASMAANVTAGRLEEMIAALEAEIDADAGALLDDLLREGKAQDPLDIPDIPGDEEGNGLPRGVTTRKLAARVRKLQRLRHAREVLAGRASADAADARAAAAEERARKAEQKAEDAERQARARCEQRARQADGPAPRGRRPGPPETSKTVARFRAAADRARDRARAAVRKAAAAPAKVNTTDPDSRVMPLKNGGYDQGYNIEISSLSRQVLAGIATHDSTTDAGALVPAVHATEDNARAAGLDPATLRLLADAGFASAASFTALKDRDLLVAVRRERAQAGRSDDGRDTIPAGWEDMAAKLGTPEGKALYKRRGAIVEPSFAQFFGRIGRYVSRRGSEDVEAELSLLAAAFNVGKYIRYA
jgi:transposase